MTTTEAKVPGRRERELLSRPATEREQLAERIASRLDLPMTVAGVALVLVLVADNSTPSGSPLDLVWIVAGWSLWAVFAAEFALRLVIAPSTSEFLRRNWWQLVFLAVPFLRFLRAFTRAARVARLASTSLRSTRTAARTLAGRLGWLSGVTVTTILASSEVLFEYGPPLSYARALHTVTIAAVAGESLEAEGAVADGLEVVLAIHATVVFAALAGSLGAFFVERRGDARAIPADGPA